MMILYIYYTTHTHTHHYHHHHTTHTGIHVYTARIEHVMNPVRHRLKVNESLCLNLYVIEAADARSLSTIRLKH